MRSNWVTVAGIEYPRSISDNLEVIEFWKSLETCKIGLKFVPIGGWEISIGCIILCRLMLIISTSKGSPIAHGHVGKFYYSSLWVQPSSDQMQSKFSLSRTRCSPSPDCLGPDAVWVLSGLVSDLGYDVSFILQMDPSDARSRIMFEPFNGDEAVFSKL